MDATGKMKMTPAAPASEMIEIRRAQVEDVPAIRAVLAATWRDTYSSFLAESVLEHVAAEWHSTKMLEAEIGRDSTFAGLARSASAGTIGMITAHSEDEILIVTRLYILPAFQRRGIGARLME